MNRRTTNTLRATAVSAAILFGSVAVAGPAAAAGGDVDVVNTETVQVYTSPTGKVDSKRLYEQLSLTGSGTVDLQNPVATDGLRNLDGFKGLDVSKGNQVVKMSVDGKQRLRSLSDFDGKLPLDVKVDYFLDGKSVEPSDIVGKSGELEVRYTVKNVTGEMQELTFPDGNGGTVTKRVEVPIPMVGTLTTTAPSSFTDVTSKAANLAGDGKGGTKLSFTMTLFPPIGSDTAVIGYKAKITDGIVPRTSIQALPVNPLESPTFEAAASGYQGGAKTGADLVAGASEIDANLLKLRDGAQDLLAGLIKLSDGADQLQAGLAGEAAPGSKKLAAGAKKLDGGTGDALAGSTRLTDGLGQISGGLGQLADNSAGLPHAKDGIAQLRAGVDLILANLGSVDQPKTLIGGLAGLDSGLAKLKAGSDQLVPGLQQVGAGLPAAKGGVDQVKSGLDDAVRQGGSVDQLIGGLQMLSHLPVCTESPQCAGLVTQLLAGAQKSKSDLTDARNGLGQVSGGLGAAVAGLNSQILPGAQQIQAGLGDAKSGSAQLSEGAVRLKGGVQQVSGGLGQLSDGVTAAVQGVLQLSSGADDAHAGSSDLTDGLGLIHGGTGDLSDGAAKLADGLGDAADGSGQLADGLRQAKEGAPALPNGAQRLSDEGTKQVVAKGKKTAQSYGELAAVMAAGAKRADAEKMVEGAPADAMGLAAYSYEIGGEDGEGSHNLERGLGALMLLAAAGGTLLVRRRMRLA